LDSYAVIYVVIYVKVTSLQHRFELVNALFWDWWEDSFVVTVENHSALAWVYYLVGPFAVMNGADHS
jgi:hypothetical protein